MLLPAGSRGTRKLITNSLPSKTKLVGRRAKPADQFRIRDLQLPFFETLAAWGPLGP